MVVDAGIGVAILTARPASDEAAALLERWIRAETDVLVPALWEYEVVSSLRNLVAAGRLFDSEAARAVKELSALGFVRVATSSGLHVSALAWAAKIGQVVAYDAAYLAVAEQFDAELWTTDRRLAQAVQAVGIDWCICSRRLETAATCARLTRTARAVGMAHAYGDAWESNPPAPAPAAAHRF